MATPEKTRASQSRPVSCFKCGNWPVADTMAAAKTTTTTVRTSVATFDGTWLTPILARTAVRPAKTAERAA